MNVTFISYSDLNGGASVSAYRLFKEFNRYHPKTRMLVQNKKSKHPDILEPKSQFSKLIARLRLPLQYRFVKRSYPSSEKGRFSPHTLPDLLDSRIRKLKPDIVNVHWIGHAAMRPETFSKIGKPIVWTLHDEWAFTGGCYYTKGCERFQDSCGSCPILESSSNNDLSRDTFERKKAAWDSIDLTIVTPSRWLAKRARSSTLFRDRRIEVIPYGIETELYRPQNKKDLRSKFGLPNNKALALFGAVGAATDPRKGFRELCQSLQILDTPEHAKAFAIVVFGGIVSKKDAGLEHLEIISLGHLSDETHIAEVYASADIFLMPSLEDNFPNTVLEAVASGLPVVGFATGGVTEMVIHERSGLLCETGNADALAELINRILLDSNLRKKMSLQSREDAKERFYADKPVSLYDSLFQELISK